MEVVIRSRLSALVVILACVSNVKHVNALVTNSRVGRSTAHVPSFSSRIVDATRVRTIEHRPPLASSSFLAKASKTRLQAISPAVSWSAVGHVIGGATGAPIVATAIQTWYRKIDLPSWTPPDRVFAPTWTALYTAMGVAAGRIYQKIGFSIPLFLWACHYLMNLLWAPVFFGLQRLRLGMIINYFLLASLAIIIPSFYKIDSLSGMLLIPYMAWLLFATALNGSICKRNPTENGYNNAMLQSDLCQLQKQAADYAGV